MTLRITQYDGFIIRLIFAGCPTTPVRGSQQTENGSGIAATVEEAIASLTTEMVSATESGLLA